MLSPCFNAGCFVRERWLFRMRTMAVPCVNDGCSGDGRREAVFCMITVKPMCMIQTVTNIWRFYRDGFRAMTWGRVLWAIILLKLFIMFVILKLFFFPDFIRESSGGLDEDDFVSRELIERRAPGN